MRNFEIVVPVYYRDGELQARRVLSFEARNLAEAKALAPKEILRQLGDKLPYDGLADVTED